MNRAQCLLVTSLLSAISISLTAVAAPVNNNAAHDKPWMNVALAADRRAELVLKQMTRDEKLTLVMGHFGSVFPEKNHTPPPEARAGSAGYIPGIPRLGIPPQWQTDAGIGVATQWAWPEKRERTALPSGLATAATWNPEVARAAGAMIGAEARASGFNVMLAGGINLVREPRNGRNFEYGGEDPLLAGVIVANQIKGIESNHIISTIKHFALNDQETNRNHLDVQIDRDQARMSDLLAFQIAIERANPGSVMSAYNKAWGHWAGENEFLLTDVLRTDWQWPGYVMSDWGGVHSTAKAANAGLDQESGSQFDETQFFGEPLKRALDAGEVSEARLNEMAHRILRTMFVKGVIDRPVQPQSAIDFAAHAKVTRVGAEEGAVLLKNESELLPLDRKLKKIAVIGGYADRGVLSGGGSSQVYPVGGNAVPGLAPTTWPGPVMYFPSAPLAHIKALASESKVEFADGRDAAAAAKLASESDVAIVFATQWTTESVDASLTLADGQDALIEAVARANPRTVVVLETGGPVYMPWLDAVPAVLEAWYPGTSGGEAIANLLFGVVNPSGRLPVTFGRDASQLTRPALVEKDAQGEDTLQVTYAEGAAVGYKWFDKNRLQPLFPFGHGLSYTKFSYSDLSARLDGDDLVVSFKVRNDGQRAGKDVPQVYVSPPTDAWEAPKRLGGWKKVDLQPGASTKVDERVDPRLLGVFTSKEQGWRIAPGSYTVRVGASSRDLKLETSVQLRERTLPAGFRFAER